MVNKVEQGQSVNQSIRKYYFKWMNEWVFNPFLYMLLRDFYSTSLIVNFRNEKRENTHLTDLIPFSNVSINY